MLLEKLLSLCTTHALAADPPPAVGAAGISSNLQTVLMPSTTTTGVVGFVTIAISWIIWIAGIMAFFYLVYSGILYVTAAGNPDQAKKGQQGVINAVIGIIVIVLAYVILNAIASTARTTSPTAPIPTSMLQLLRLV